MIQTWIDILMGPLFALTFLFMVLGLGRHLVLQLDTLIRRKGHRLKHMPWNKMFKDSLGWAFPFKHLVTGNVVFSNASFLFHIGAIIVPLFLLDHIALWEGVFKVNLPAISPLWADILTVITIVTLLILLLNRTLVSKVRAISRPSDYWMLILILLPFTTGFLAAHPSMNPLRWESMFLLHLLSAQVLFVVIPFSKLSHIVLIFFDRISEVHWQLRPGAGDRIAEALYGKEAKV